MMCNKFVDILQNDNLDTLYYIIITSREGARGRQIFKVSERLILSETSKKPRKQVRGGVRGRHSHTFVHSKFRKNEQQ